MTHPVIILELQFQEIQIKNRLELLGNVEFNISINLVSKSFHLLLTIIKMLQTLNKNVTFSKIKCD